MQTVLKTRCRGEINFLMNLRFKTSYVTKQDVRILNLDGNLSYLSTSSLRRLKIERILHARAWI